MKWILIFSLLVCLNAVASENVVFEDERYKSEIFPLIHENLNSLNDSVHFIENNQEIVVISIVSTPLKLKDGRPKSLPDMLKITLNKGMSAISRFIETTISTESEMFTNSASEATQSVDQKFLKSKSKYIINERMVEQSSMVMVNSKAYAYWFTEDKMFLKRAVILIL